jgi:hypothetical protein
LELLVIIGLTLIIATAACALVEAMAQARGRDARAWTVAAFIGLMLAIVGYGVVVIALLLAGPAHDHGARRRVMSSHLPHAPRP